MRRLAPPAGLKAAHPPATAGGTDLIQVRLLTFEARPSLSSLGLTTQRLQPAFLFKSPNHPRQYSRLFVALVLGQVYVTLSLCSLTLGYYLGRFAT